MFGCFPLPPPQKNQWKTNNTNQVAMKFPLLAPFSSAASCRSSICCRVWWLKAKGVRWILKLSEASQFGEEGASPDASQAKVSCLTASTASSLAPLSRSVWPWRTRRTITHWQAYISIIGEQYVVKERVAWTSVASGTGGAGDQRVGIYGHCEDEDHDDDGGVVTWTQLLFTPLRVDVARNKLYISEFLGRPFQ